MLKFKPVLRKDPDLIHQHTVINESGNTIGEVFQGEGGTPWMFQSESLDSVLVEDMGEIKQWTDLYDMMQKWSK